MMHMQCFKWFQKLHNHYSQNVGRASLTMDILANLLSPCMQVRKQQLELDMEQQTGSK